MATLKEYFDTDFNRCLTLHDTWELRNQEGIVVQRVIAKIALEFDANAKFWAFYIDNEADINALISFLISQPNVRKCVLSEQNEGIQVETGLAGYSEKIKSSDLKFTQRIFIYFNNLINESARKQIASIGENNGFSIVVRDKEYSSIRSSLEKPLAFISHDSRDKDSLVRNLVHELSKSMCPVWYDEYSLKVGDSLRSSIEAGLKETKKCIVILSPNFISNAGWGKAEFDSIYTREIIEKDNVMLPIWHNVDVNDVYQYSPRLADKVGLNSNLGIEELARRLIRVIKQQ